MSRDATLPQARAKGKNGKAKKLEKNAKKDEKSAKALEAKAKKLKKIKTKGKCEKAHVCPVAEKSM